MMNTKNIFMLALCLMVASVPKLKAQVTESTYNLEALLPAVDIFDLVSVSKPVIKRGDPGTEDNKYGLEGGCAFLYKGEYQLFTAERHDDPVITAMRLAHWSSKNGKKWQRNSTVVQGSADFKGIDIKSSLWSPMPVFDAQTDRWNLFYVMYQSKPDEGEVFYRNYNGRVMRAVSQSPGYDGLAGPYEDEAIILEPGIFSDEWEGLQGTDSFFPFKVKDKWYGFYGSAQTQANKNPKYPHWAVGLAVADSLTGNWTRWTEINPVRLHHHFAENPIVTQLKSGLYVAFVDTFDKSAIAYSTSKDGKTWTKATSIFLDQKRSPWWTQMRTPLGLIEEKDGSFTVFFTAFTEGGLESFAALGMVKLKLKENI